jgi:hypothetical protein
MVILYIPAYWLHFLSGAGQQAQNEFDEGAAPVIDANFSGWRWAIKGAVIILCLPAMFVAAYPLPASLISLSALSVVTLWLRSRLRRAVV